MGAGLYLHIPFCLRRCPYCAFFSTVCEGEVPSEYADALIREMRMRKGEKEWPEMDTVYLGGGTPSLLSPRDLTRILQAVRDTFSVSDGAEITLEGNPGTVDGDKLAAFIKAGVNRLSLGVQSFRDDTLNVLGRIHTAEHAVKAFQVARAAGFDNLSLDLMFGVPGETTEHWLETLRLALELKPEHLSLYALTVEEGTALKSAVFRGDIEIPSEDEQAEQCRMSSDLLREAGFIHYEVSNYCLPKKRSRHNWGCWTGKPYWGLGASAHSFDRRKRSWNVSDLADYTDRVLSGEDPTEGEEILGESTGRFERICLGLRTEKGVYLTQRERDYLLSSPQAKQWIEAAFVKATASGIALTEEGFLRADALSVEVAEVFQGIVS